MQILVDIDGVIRGSNDELIATGALMYGTLTAYNRMILMTSLPKRELEFWLNVNKIVDFDLVVDGSVKLEGEDLKQRQITYARSQGAIDLFITADPTLWAFAFEQGIPSVMFGVPSYLRPEFRPDAPKKIRAWDEIQQAIDKQNEARTKDVRLSRSDGFNFE
jgi:hypothetical protein